MNPFSITKASDFSNEDIAKYWVDFTGSGGKQLKLLLNPLDSMPKFILGSKGCGKTHLLRYHDYPIQKIRNGNNAKDVLCNEKYIGIYFLLGDLNSTRFNRESLGNERRQSLFEYYMELFISIQVLLVIKDIINSLGVQDREKAFCHDIKNEFISLDYVFNELDDVIDCLCTLQKEIDNEIVNSDLALDRSDNRFLTKILIARGTFILNIPLLFTKHFAEYKNIRFLYILDEYDKISESQKTYINTLIWEKKNPCSFWIGSRNYGFTNTNTYHNQELRQNAEYEKLQLDVILRQQKKKYKSFCKQVFKTRLLDLVDKNSFKKNPNSYFESFNEADVLEKINIKFQGKIKPHTKGLISNLKNIIVLKDPKLRLGLRHNSEEDIAYIVETLSVPENPLYEKFNYFLFYREWAKRKNIIESSRFVKSEFEKFKTAPKLSEHRKVIEYYKNDLLAQLLEETKSGGYFSGLDTFTDLSWGNPRIFISILKNIYKSALYNDEKPFEDGIISIESQEKGILESSNEFYEDAELAGSDGMNVYKAISNISQFLRGVRFSDIPSQSSLSSFSISSNFLLNDASKIVKLAVDHSFLIEIEQGRKDQNSSKISYLYQVNRILAPKWNLPIARRGVIPLSKELVEAIFNPSSFKNYEIAYSTYMSGLNAPFSKKSTNNEQEELFK